MNRRKTLILIVVIILLLFLPLVYFRDPLSARIFSAYLGGQLNADITIKKVHLGLGPRLEIEGLRIISSKGLDCDIKASTLDFNLQSVFKKRLGIRFYLKDVGFFYSTSKVIKGMTDALSIEAPQHLHFDYVKGEFYRIGEENIIKSLDAKGELLRIFADGSMRGLLIDYSFKFLLSKELTDKVPESVKNIFFKQDNQYSEVELYVTGSVDNPSINLSTDLFKLTVR